MDLYRFYTPKLMLGTLYLTDEEAHHARAVLRLEAGARVEVFDGKGRWAAGVLTQVSKREVTVGVEKISQSAAPAIQLTLATAIPKTDRAEWLIEQASQLNVARVQWMDWERGVVKSKEGGNKMEKWRRVAIESAKQCGRNFLLEVLPARGVKEVLEEARKAGARILWLEPRGERRLGEVVAELRQVPGEVVALIGPEGGWSAGEMELLGGTAGVERVRLTETILRIETACAAVGAGFGV